MIRRYVWNILTALDQGANALLGGDPDETISSRTAKAAEKGVRVAKWACVVYGWFDPDHCAKHVERDEGEKAIFLRRKP